MLVINREKSGTVSTRDSTECQGKRPLEKQTTTKKENGIVSYIRRERVRDLTKVKWREIVLFYFFNLGTLKNPRLGMYHQNACLFYNRIAYDRDYSGLSTDDEEGMRTGRQLRDKSVLFMCNHGVLVVADTAARAFDDVYYLERACMTQVRYCCRGLRAAWIYIVCLYQYCSTDSSLYIYEYSTTE